MKTYYKIKELIYSIELLENDILSLENEMDSYTILSINAENN
jgi:hypothetical protein